MLESDSCGKDSPLGTVVQLATQTNCEKGYIQGEIVTTNERAMTAIPERYP